MSVTTTQTGSSVRADPEEMRRSIDLLLEPGQVTELRALDVTTADYRRPHTVSGYFDSPEALVRSAAGLSTSAKGLYIVLNPVNPALLARAAMHTPGS